MSQVQEYALAGILAIFAYYVTVWRLLGRDLPPGVIIPLFDPPDGLSAAAIYYVRHRMYGGVCAIAALIQVAVKGHLRIEWDGTTMRLTRRAATTPLTADEEAFLSSLVSDGTLELSRADLGTDLVSGIARFMGASQQLKAALTAQLAGVIKEHRFWMPPYSVKMSEQRTRPWVIGGGVLSLGWVALVGGLLAAAEGPPAAGADPGAGAMTLGMLIAALVMNGGFGFPGVRINGSLYFELACVTALLWLLSVEGAPLGHARWIPVGSTILLGMHLGMLYTLPRPNKEWRLLADKIEGFRMYLETAEGDEIALLAKLPPDQLPPPSTSERIERLIPYAVALGIEVQPGWTWMRRSTDTGGGMPRFTWYEGTADMGDYLRWIGQALTGIGSAARGLVAEAGSTQQPFAGVGK